MSVLCSPKTSLSLSLSAFASAASSAAMSPDECDGNEDGNGNDGGRSTTTTRLFVKGAPGPLLRRCVRVKLRNGRVLPLTPEIREKLEDAVSSLGGRALRCLGLALREGIDLPDIDLVTAPTAPAASEGRRAVDVVVVEPKDFASVESDLTFVGLVGIKDPARPGVRESIDV